MRAWALTALPILLCSCVAANTVAANPPPPPPTPHVDPAVVRGAESGKKQRFAIWFSLTPDCANVGYVAVKVVREPVHGKVAIEQGEGYSDYPKDEVRAACNKVKSPATLAFYTSEPGFTGSDTLSLEAIGPGGRFFHIDYIIQVR